MSLVCESTPKCVRLGMLRLTSSILEEIRIGKKPDVNLVDKLILINQGRGGEFRIDENDVMRFGDRVCVPDVAEIKKSILEKGHRSGVLLRSLLSSSAQGHQLPPFPLPSNDNVKVTELGNNLNFNSLGFVKIVHVAIYVHF